MQLQCGAHRAIVECHAQSVDGNTSIAGDGVTHGAEGKELKLRIHAHPRKHVLGHLNSLSQNRARAIWLCNVVLMQAMGGIGEAVKLKDGGGAVPDACAPADTAVAAARAWAI